MTEDQITYAVRACIYAVYKQLGPGLLESVYEEALVYELKKKNLHVEQQKKLPIIYDGVPLKSPLVIDLLVEGKVIIELKSVQELTNVHYKQLMTYLKLSKLYVGQLVNFNVNDIAEGIHRVFNSKARNLSYGPQRT